MPDSSTDDEEKKVEPAAAIPAEADPAPPSSDDAQAADAPSPGAEEKDDKQPKDMVSAVRAALEKGKEPSSSSSDSEDGAEPKKAESEPEKKEGEEEDLGELTEDELNSYKPKTQRRMRQLLSKNEELTEQVAQSGPIVEQFQGIKSFCEKANLSSKDVNTGFELMNLMRNDPQQAFKQLTPIYDTLRQMVGEVLPDDLQQQVSEGRITEDHAKELSRLRSSQTLTAQQSQQQEANTAEDDRRKSVETLRTNCATAVSKWEAEWKASDPDYRVKQARVMSEIKLALYEAKSTGNLPTTQEEAVKLANTAKKTVEEELKRIMPPKASVTPITKVRSATDSTSAPKNMLEAVKQAVGQA